MAAPETTAPTVEAPGAAPPAPDVPATSLLDDPIILVALIGGGAFLFLREIRDLRARDREAAGDPARAGALRREMLSVSFRVLIGSLVMMLFGLSLLVGSLGLLPREVAMNVFALSMIPAIAALLYAVIWGVPDAVARWIFGR